MRKIMMWMLCAGLLAVSGCSGQTVEGIEHMAEYMKEQTERIMLEIDMAASAMEKPEPSFAAQLAVAADLEQIIIVEAKSEDGIEAVVTMHELQDGIWTEILRVDGYLGYGGINKVREGDGKTPTGLYGLSVAFGKKEDPGSILPYTQIDETYWWVGDYDSKYFNQLCQEDMEGRDWELDPSVSEHLWDYKGYNYCLFVEYNVEGVDQKGSCIFLHCIGQKLETLGCIAVAEEDMIFILQHVREGCKILIDTAENLPSY